MSCMIQLISDRLLCLYTQSDLCVQSFRLSVNIFQRLSDLCVSPAFTKFGMRVWYMITPSHEFWKHDVLPIFLRSGISASKRFPTYQRWSFSFVCVDAQECLYGFVETSYIWRMKFYWSCCWVDDHEILEFRFVKTFLWNETNFGWSLSFVDAHKIFQCSRVEPSYTLTIGFLLILFFVYSQKLGIRVVWHSCTCRFEFLIIWALC